jgi:DMSO/TMAO reductase YedYZ molybdopterin-dependent catalytic subunit
MTAPPLRARLRPSRGTGRAVVAGLLAAGAGVAGGELVGGLVSSAGSPVVGVGGEVIDRAPKPMKDFAIDTFGTNDKTALIVGTLVLLLLLGMALGPLARRHARIAAGVVVAVAALGAVATAHQEGISLLVAAWPSLLGGAAAVGVMAWLCPPPVLARQETADDLPARENGADGLPPRRTFLVGAGAVVVLGGAAAAGGRVLQARGSAAGDRAALALPAPTDPLPPISRAVAPNPRGVAPFVTPNADFYRIDTALRIPQLTTGSYRLKVKGMVERELDISWAELIDRDLHEYDITLTCVSNQIGDTLVGNARWLGFPLRDLLDEAGVEEGVDQVVGRSKDRYTGGFPLEAAYDRDCIVAVGMNGEPLPLAHGYPVRLVTPGLYGYLSAVKWLTEVELTTFAAFDSYWVPRGYAEQAPIRTMSRIDTPRSLRTVPAGPVVIGGVAYAQTRGIAKVEVRIDRAEWVEAELSEALNDDTWRQWTLRWDDPPPGDHTIEVRATDGTGETQPEERRAPLPDGATGWHTVRARVAS